MWISTTWELQADYWAPPRASDSGGPGQGSRADALHESPGEADDADPRASVSVSAGEREASPKPERSSAAPAESPDHRTALDGTPPPEDGPPRSQELGQKTLTSLLTVRISCEGSRTSSLRQGNLPS